MRSPHAKASGVDSEAEEAQAPHTQRESSGVQWQHLMHVLVRCACTVNWGALD